MELVLCWTQGLGDPIQLHKQLLLDIFVQNEGLNHRIRIPEILHGGDTPYPPDGVVVQEKPESN
jgi:hypothetical protein